MEKSTEKSSCCAPRTAKSCGCAAKPSAERVDRGCCCGPECGCGESCACPSGCGCSAR